MRVPAALHRWAAEHNQQLSPSTRQRVDVIANIIEASSMRDDSIFDTGPAQEASLRQIFPEGRADEAVELIAVVRQWAVRLPADAGRTTIADVGAGRPVSPEPPSAADPSLPDADGPTDNTALGTPAFLRSDRVDEDDRARFYGTAGSYLRVIFAILSVLALAALAIGVWFWIQNRGDAEIADETPASDVVDATDDNAPLGTENDAAEPETEPTPTVETILELPVVNWADTTTVLSSGTSPILATTYPVSPANRAVLTGHTAAVTGIVVTDEGRVLTSGADARLVDWGSDVTLANPDVLDVAAPLTVLIRTADQRLLAGDSDGNVTVISLTDTIDPTVVALHTSAVSAIAELGDGRLAAASVDGDVRLFDPSVADAGALLSHPAEVTSLAVLADGSLASASVDGIVRIWDVTSDSQPEPLNLGLPLTALLRLRDDTLAVAGIDGSIRLLDPTTGAVTTEFSANDGAVRALYEFDDERAGRTLASGGDDSTIRLFRLPSGDEWQRLDGHGDLVSAINQLPDGRLVSTSGDGTGRVWNLELADGPLVRTPHNWNISDIASWRNDQFVTGGVDGLVVLNSTTEDVQPAEITRHGAPIVGIAVMPNGDVVSLDSTSVLRLNEIGPDAAEPFELTVAPGATSMSNLGETGIVTGHIDGTIRFSDFTAELVTVEAHEAAVSAVLGLSDGRVASGGEDNAVHVTDLEAPDALFSFDAHSAPVTALTELPDGRIASAATEEIWVWSPGGGGDGGDGDGEPAAPIRLTGHRAEVLNLVALADGRLLSTARDGRVRLWDLLNDQADPVTLLDVPGIVNPVLARAGNGLFVSAAGRGYVVFTIE